MKAVVQRPLTGITLVPFVLAIVTYSLVTSRYIAFSVFLMALLLACWLYGFMSRFRIHLEIQAPTRVTEGEPVEMSLLIRSRGRLPRFISQSVAEIIQPQSMSERRRRRQWHQMFYRQAPLSPATASDDGNAAYRMDGFILRRGLSRIHRRLDLTQRGVVQIKSLRLYVTDPLGIFPQRPSFAINHSILVRVRPTTGAPMLQFSGASGRLDTHAKVGESGDMTEFAGTRIYRSGDDLKHIHWPTVAKTGELYVREYTQSSADSIVVLLLRSRRQIAGGELWDTPYGGEMMLKAAAALVIELFNRRVHVYFGTNIAGAEAIDIGYSKRALHTFHDGLSSISWNAKLQPMSFLERMTIPGVDQSGVIAFSADPPDPEVLAEIPASLRISSSRILVVTAVKDARSALPKLPLGMRSVPCYIEEPETLFRDLSF